MPPAPRTPTPTPRPPTPPTSIEVKLDAILVYLKRMDRRDHWRTIGGFFRSLIAIIPVILLLWSAWYFVEHGAELMKMVANQAASAAAEYTKSQSQGIFDKFMNQGNSPK